MFNQILSADLVEKLVDLVQLDIDAVFAYNHAVDHIEETDIREHMVRYREDHERHIADLSQIIIKHGGTPPERTKDFKGYIIEGMTAVMSKIGTRSSLLAMMSNEELTTSRYRAANAVHFPTEIKALIADNLKDEQRHLTYIKEALKQKFSYHG